MPNKLSYLSCLVALPLLTSVGQAALVNVTQGNKVIWNDTFETGTVGQAPVANAPETGSYTLISAGTGTTITTNDSTSGTSAYYGNKFLTISRPNTGNVELTAMGQSGASANGDLIRLEIAFRVASAATTNSAVGTLRLCSNGATTSPLLSINFFGAATTAVPPTTASSIVIGTTTLTQKFNVDEWNTLVVEHVNGSTAWAISVNGAAQETVNNGTGTTANWDSLNFRAGSKATTFQIDSSAIPEPASAAVLGLGGLGLLTLHGRRHK